MATIWDILKAQSEFTWSIMHNSAQLGEMIREDAITSVNLAAIKGAADRAREQIYIFSNQGAHLEQETGADWQWGALKRYWVVQAKRLDVVPGRGGGQTYTINLQQLYKVIDQAKAIQSEQAPYLPAYVFYNSMTTAFGNADDVNTRRDWGCAVVEANGLLSWIGGNIQLKTNQQTVTLTPANILAAGAAPWYRMFPEQIEIL